MHREKRLRAGIIGMSERRENILEKEVKLAAGLYRRLIATTE